MNAAASGEIDYGFRKVGLDEKQGLVDGVFDHAARRYDVMNDLMSGGLHRLWKDAMISWLAPPRRPAAPWRALDLAGGTGDIAFLALERGAGRVILSDVNPAMLAVAEKRALDRGIIKGLSVLAVDAEHIPLPDRSVEKVSIAFGLRNCTDKDAVLREAYRVLRPGGRFHCLEFSRVEVAALEGLYDAWSFKALPALGARFAGDAESYRYLAESIRMFPDQETLAGMLNAAGFERVQYRNMSGGIVAIHTGWRL